MRRTPSEIRALISRMTVSASGRLTDPLKCTLLGGIRHPLVRCSGASYRASTQSRGPERCCWRTATRRSGRMLIRTPTVEGSAGQTAAGGGTALAAAERSLRDAIVVDVALPGVDGLAVTRRLRAEGPRAYRCCC